MKKNSVIRNSIISLIVSLLFIFVFTISVSADGIETSITSDSNTFIVKTSDGFMLFAAVNSSDYTIEYYDSEFNLLSSSTVTMELPLFGGFYSTADNYYVLSGQSNKDESNSVECVRLTKYTKSWSKVSKCSISGCNTLSPFGNRGASFDISGNRLIIRTSHTMYKSEDGLNHQANMVFMIDVSKMTLQDSMYSVANETAGYCSHSFKQFTRIDDNHVIGADMGDAYPRAMMISYYKTDITSGKFTSGYNSVKVYKPLSISGDTGNNYTGTTLGGLEISDSSYIIAGTSIDQSNFSSSKTYNVFIGTGSKSSTATSLKWLTNNAEGSESCTNVHIVKISSNKFFVAWQKGNLNTQYAFIDGSCNLIGSVYSVTGLIGNCQPILDNGKIVWFVYKNGSIIFFRVDSSTGGFESLTPLDISLCNVSAVSDQVYTGAEIKPSLTIKCNDTTLKENTDYTLTYSSNLNVGTAKITINGIGKYRSTKSVTFKIIQADASLVTLSEPATAEYTGAKRVPVCHFKYGNVDLVSGTDYSTTITSEGIELGDHTATITFRGNYKGTKDITYKVVRADIANQTISFSTAYYNCGNPCEPSLSIRNISFKYLVKDTDFTVSYSENTEVGEGKATITGIGNYTGVTTLPFTIVPHPINSGLATSYPYSLYYNGDPITPTYTMKLGDYQLIENVDYTCSYSGDNIKVGEFTCTYTGIGNFSGERTKTFTISPQYISYATITVQTPVYYDGTAKEPAFTVEYNNHILVSGTDYSYEYSNNTNAGYGQLKLTGMGNFNSTKTVSFLITGKPIDSLSISTVKSQTYSGSQIKPEPTIKDGSYTLVKDTDYTLSYSNNLNAGTATITVKGKGNYSGTRDVEFTINPMSIKGMTMTLNTSSYTYNGNERKPSVTLKNGDSQIYSSNYDITYKNNINAGTATATVTGKGNYCDSLTAEFTINPYSLSSYYVSVEAIPAQTYTGAEITPEVVITYNSNEMIKGSDYTVEYSNNVNKGTASVTFTGKGNFTGTRTSSFRIDAKSIASATVTTVKQAIYTGFQIKPDVTVKDGGITLIYNTDYYLSYTSNTAIGTATITVTGKGNYSGSTSVTFEIIADPTNFSVAAIADQTYTGAEIKPDVVVTSGGTTLTKGTDYTVAYSDNINVGTATVIVSGKGSYSGDKQVTFKIVAKSLKAAGITIDSIAANEYTGAAIEPGVTVKDNGKNLTLNIDYKLEYLNNSKAGEATVTVTGKGNYKDSRTVTFTINARSITPNIDDIASQTYDGKAKTPSVIVRDGSNVISSGNYTVKYDNNINAGTAKVTVTLKGNYSGSATKKFTILPRSLASAVISNVDDQLYTGEEIKPVVAVTLDGITMIDGTDYDVTYLNNIEVGEATIVVTGKGNYSGELTLVFNIVDKTEFTGWVTDAKGKKYYYENGAMVLGFKTIEGKRYYFSKKSGKMLTGWRELAGKKYYFNPKTGAATVNGKKIDGKYYLFSAKGVMQKSGWKNDSKGNTYYLKKSGVAYTKKWAKKKGKWYYFGSNGKMVKGTSLKIGKKTYKFKSNGICKNP